MEDKVLWIALKLFLVWLFVMAFCLCICNCLFIRSDRRKTKAAKLAGRAALERHKKLSNRQCCDCDDEEKLVGSSRAVIVPRREKPVGQPPQLGKSEPQEQPQPPPHLVREDPICAPQNERAQMTGQVPHSGYIHQHHYRGANPTFAFQHPSTDDVNASPVTEEIPTTGTDTRRTRQGERREWKGSAKKSSSQVSSELLLSLLSTPSGKYLLLGKEERFPRIETASNPDLNVEKRLVPTRVPFRAHRQLFTAQLAPGDSLEETDTSDSDESINLPQTPALVITEVDALERPRSSSFSGTSSCRHPSPFRIRITPSPCPSPSSHEGDRQSPHFGLSSGGTVTVDIGDGEPIETLEDYLTPSRLRTGAESGRLSGRQQRKSTVSDV